MDYAKTKKRIVFLQALVTAHEAVEAGKVIKEAPIEAVPSAETVKMSALTSARNIALANDPESLKGKLLGTLTTEPIVDQVELERDAGMDSEEAAAVIVERERIRPEGLALTEIVPKEPIK